MKIQPKPLLVAATLALLILAAVPNQAAPQRFTTLLANAHGQGTVTVGREVFKVSNVVVKLKEDGTGEIILITDLQLFVTCTWSAPADLSQGIDLKIAGGPASAEGSGKLFLRPDGKAIARLSLEGQRSNSKRKIKLKFIAD
jgi:hypothetical protein